MTNNLSDQGNQDLKRPLMYLYKIPCAQCHTFSPTTEAPTDEEAAHQLALIGWWVVGGDLHKAFCEEHAAMAKAEQQNNHK